MVRVGIGLYGLWPSKETLLSCLLAGKEQADLKPALTWKTRIAQLKRVESGSSVGYGCTHRTSRPTRLAPQIPRFVRGADGMIEGPY